jgi:hypothetical protein
MKGWHTDDFSFILSVHRLLRDLHRCCILEATIQIYSSAIVKTLI